MSIQHIIPKLQALPRGEKLQAIQFLVNELAKEEQVNLLEEGQKYEVWSPYEAFEAADQLQEFLLDERRKRSES